MWATVSEPQCLAPTPTRPFRTSSMAPARSRERAASTPG